MIPQSFIDDLLSRVDIIDVVERYVPLKRAGANHVACCPFHKEKSPSFTVSQTKQFYHCFGCGAHGSAIGFLIENQGLTFVEAVHELARSVGMPVPESQPSERAKARAAEGEDLPELNEKAMHFYKAQLKRSDVAIEYLKKRGLTGEIAARFGIGYAPPGWRNLESVFPDYQAKPLVVSGLVIDNEDGKRYDRFRDRIMFPIADQRGRVIGFGGRVLDKGEPKYLNSPETPLFEKGRELYGLYQARAAIKEAGRVLVVEGYMDVVALAQSGIGYAVATLGTSTTPTHVQKLLRQADHVIFSFDGDAAGRKAAWRALENSLEQTVDGKRLSFLFLPQGEDPDSYVRRFGREAFERLLDKALPLSEFMLQALAERADLHSDEGRARFLDMAKPLLKKVAAPALGLVLRKRAAEVAEIEQGELEELYQIRTVSKPGVSEERPQRRRNKTQLPSPVRWLLRSLLFNPELALRIDRAILEHDGAEVQALLALLETLESNPGTRGVALLESFRGTPHYSLLQAVQAEIIDWREDEDVDSVLNGALRRLREEANRRRLEELLKKPLSTLTPEERSQIDAEIKALKMPT